MGKNRPIEVSRDITGYVTVTFMEKGAFAAIPPKDDDFLRRYRYVIYDADGNAIFGIDQL